MTKLFKILGFGLLIFLAIPVALYLVVFLSNLHDDELDRAVARLLATAPRQISTADNGYFAWIGVVGPAGESPHAWGSRWFREALAADKKSAVGDQRVELPIDNVKRKDELSAEIIPCDQPESCLEALAAKPDVARAALAKGKTLLERCDTAIALPAYQEAWRPDFSVTSPFPPYPPFWRQLSATRFALAVAEERDDEALAQLGKEMAFHRRQLTGAATLVGKMVAVSYLRNDYLLLNRYLLRHSEATRDHAEQIAALLAPLTPEALQLRPVMESEWRASMRMFFALRDQAAADHGYGFIQDAKTGTLAGRIGGALATPLFLPNASANELYRLHSRRLLADGEGNAAYREALAAARQQSAAKTGSIFDSLALRNPIGHILVLVGAPAYDSYFSGATTSPPCELPWPSSWICCAEARTTPRELQRHCTPQN